MTFEMKLLGIKTRRAYKLHNACITLAADYEEEGNPSAAKVLREIASDNDILEKFAAILEKIPA